METESTLFLERAHQLADQRALIERARRGDSSAHCALYDTHVDRIYRLTYRLTGVENLARELTQDTFVRAFASIEGFRGDSAFGTWLHMMVRSVVALLDVDLGVRALQMCQQVARAECRVGRTTVN